MWTSLAGAALLATAFLWLTFQLWRYSRAVGSELSIHRRALLSRRLQALVLGSAAVATIAFALHGAFVLQSADPRAQRSAHKPVMLRFDSELRFAPARPQPAVPALDDLALAETAR